MRTATLISLTVISLLAVPQDANEAPRTKTTTAGPVVVAAARAFERKAEFQGVFVPVDAVELSVWPEAYAGELLLIEVLPHGSFVNEGEVVARFETRALAEEIESAQRALRSAELTHEGSLAREELDSASAKERLETSLAALKRTRRSLAGYLEQELDFASRSSRATLRAYANRVQDQQDELEQLEAMYREDELFAATEEIVLRRNRRNLHEAELSSKLQEERATHDRELTIPLAVETRKEQLALQESAHERAVKSAELDAAARADALRQGANGLADQRRRLARLEEDLARLTLVAPRGGVLLHGGLADYGPSRVRPLRRRGERCPSRTALFTLVDPERLSLAFEVGESQLGDIHGGQAVEVSPHVAKTPAMVGNLTLSHYPTPNSAAAAENMYACKVTFERLRPGLVVGSRGLATLVLERRESVVVLPRAAVFGRGAQAHCWLNVGEGNEFVRTPVKLGSIDGEEVLIEEGVEAGQRVLLFEPGS